MKRRQHTEGEATEKEGVSLVHGGKTRRNKKDKRDESDRRACNRNGLENNSFGMICAEAIVR